MLFEYFIYVFIGIGFFAGLIRGWKKELINFVSLTVALFVILLSYNTLLDVINNVFPLSKIYDIDIISKIVGAFGVSVHGLEFLVIGIIPSILIYLLLSKVFNIIFFNPKKVIEGKIKEGNKLLGSIVGILSGFIFSVFLLLPLASTTYSVDLSSGTLTKFIVNNFPFVKNVISNLGIVL